jgi:hypothetical protein
MAANSNLEREKHGLQDILEQQGMALEHTVRPLGFFFSDQS